MMQYRRRGRAGEGAELRICSPSPGVAHMDSMHDSGWVACSCLLAIDRTAAVRYWYGSWYGSALILTLAKSMQPILKKTDHNPSAQLAKGKGTKDQSRSSPVSVEYMY